MRKFMKRVLALGVVMVICLSCFPMSIVAKGEWCPIYIDQGDGGKSRNGVYKVQGCTVCTFQLILQNSGTLKTEWQLPSGKVSSRTDLYHKFDLACCNGLAYGSAVTSGYVGPQGSRSSDSHGGLEGFVRTASSLCKDGVTWSYTQSVEGQSTSKSGSYIVGLGGKDFLEMSPSEFASAMKAFWNNGYFVVVAIRYTKNLSSTQAGRSTGNGTGDSKYAANHWVMLDCIEGNDVIFNNPGGGSSTSYNWGYNYSGSSNGYNYYKVAYIAALSNNQTSPLSLSGGVRQIISAEDEKNYGNLGVSSDIATGLPNGQTVPSLNASLSDSALLSSCRLVEANLDGLLDIVSPDNLGQDDLEMLEGWRINIDGNKKEFGFISVLRWVVSLAGILITLWAILVYLAFWFDHINSFVYLDALHILTFGALHICPHNEKPTFSLGKSVKDKTVSHGQILCICVTALLFGTALISGVFYQAVSALVRLIQSFI